MTEDTPIAATARKYGQARLEAALLDSQRLVECGFAPLDFSAVPCPSCTALQAEITRLQRELIDQRRVTATLRCERNGEVWIWQGDGEDHLESLTCPVLIRPEQLRALQQQIPQWQPIATAPKDGTLVIVADGPDVWAARCPLGSKWSESLSGWQPLPAPPIGSDTPRET